MSAVLLCSLGESFPLPRLEDLIILFPSSLGLIPVLRTFQISGVGSKNIFQAALFWKEVVDFGRTDRVVRDSPRINW